MKTDSHNKTRLFVTVLGLGCAVALTAMIVRSLVQSCYLAPEPGPAESAAAGQAAIRPDPKSISVAGEHPFIAPVAEASASPRLASQPQSAPPRKSPGFNADFRAAQERERERRATIEKLRATISSGNLDSNAVMQQEKKLKEMEDSGASFM